MKTNPFFLRAIKFTALLALTMATGPMRAATAAVAEEVDEYAAPHVSDPFERINRAVFRFNDTFYKHVLRPFAHGYEHVVPAPLRRGLGNFFDNLKFPVRFVSAVLRLKLPRAGRETGKFLLNSTAGVGGLLRVSDSVPALANVPPGDVGQTFGAWGIGAGPYLVLPFFGPSSLRDTLGLVGDTALTPVNWPATRRTVHGYNSSWRYSLQAADLANSSPDLLRTYDGFKQAAVNPYISVRNGYLQYRAAGVKK